MRLNEILGDRPMTAKTATAQLDANSIATIVTAAVSAAMTKRQDQYGPPLSAGVERAMTTEGSHIAIEKGYAVLKSGGFLILPDERVPAGIPVSDIWMRETTDEDRAPREDA